MGVGTNGADVALHFEFIRLLKPRVQRHMATGGVVADKLDPDPVGSRDSGAGESSYSRPFGIHSKQI